MDIPVPEGEIAKRTLEFFWLTDCSASMSGTKIATLNRAIREALPEIAEAVSTHPEVRVLMRAIRFTTQAEWHVGPEAVPLEHFMWPELQAGGSTATAQAIRLLAGELDLEKMPRRGLPPVCILVSDGYCTEPTEAYAQAIAELEALPWGKKCVRLAIAIGDDNDYDEEELLKFVSHKDIGVLKAYTVQELIYYIKWASVTATVSSSVGKSRTDQLIAGSSSHVLLLPPPANPALSSSNDVF